ncbi:MAG: alpha/beta hydrolase [Kofleriaceae bacterium]|nr:alpha/beta hydrolase [Kofleriaceae bacterium]
MSDAPGPITPTKTMTVAAPSGALYAEVFLPKEPPKGVVVVTHGYAEHCGRYHEVAHVIVNAGWAALAYDVRGHGQSPGARGFIDRFDTYLDDLRAVHAEAQKLAPGKPLVLLGHSHGSLITLRALCGEQPPAAVAAVVASPYLGLRLAVPGYKKLLARVASRVAPALAQPNSLRVEDLTHDKQKQAERVADKLCFDVATARWFTESSAAQAFVAEHANRIKVPTTWLVGGADPIADPATSKRVAASVPNAHYHDLAGLRHEVFNEVDRGKVFSQLASVLAAHGAASA